MSFGVKRALGGNFWYPAVRSGNYQALIPFSFAFRFCKYLYSASVPVTKLPTPTSVPAMAAIISIPWDPEGFFSVGDVGAGVVKGATVELDIDKRWVVEGFKKVKPAYIAYLVTLKHWCNLCWCRLYHFASETMYCNKDVIQDWYALVSAQPLWFTSRVSHCSPICCSWINQRIFLIMLAGCIGHEYLPRSPTALPKVPILTSKSACIWGGAQQVWS